MIRVHKPIQATMSVDIIQAIMPAEEERLCYICCEPDSPENRLISEAPCLCKTMDIHTSCYLQLRQTLGSKCKACKQDFPWRPLLTGNQRMLTYNESNRLDLKFMTIYEVDGEGLPHGRMETVRYDEGGVKTKRYWCGSCREYHDDGVSKTYPGLKSVISTGEFVHGVRHGLWCLYPCTSVNWECDQPWVSVNYVDGIPHGEVNLKYYRNNDREMTEETFTMVNGVIQGRRSIVTGMFRGHTYELECNYLDGKLHGMLKMQQRFVTCDGQEYHQTTTQEYHHDEPKGSRITYMQPIFGPLNHIKMLQSVVSIRNGKLNGTVAMYHPGTSKQLAFIANFRDGILKGKFRRWDERGELMESHFFTGEEHYQPDQEYDILKTWIDSQIDLTLYEVPPLKAHIMTAIDPDHSVGFSFPDPSLLSPNVMLTIMDNTFNTVKGLKHFKGYFSTSTYDDDYYYPPRYEDEDYYSDDYDDGASSEWDFSRSR